MTAAIGDNGGKQVKELVKKTYINDPWIRTMAWRLWEQGIGLEEGGMGEKLGYL